MKKIKRRVGFTMMEVLVVLIIVAILAAIAVPSVYSFVQSGRQTNRMNVARTLYLAAQSQLTELQLTRGLRAALPEYYDENRDLIEENLHERGGVNTNVYDLLGFTSGSVPDTEDSNARAFVHYISKPAGAAPDGLMQRLLDPVVLDKTVLNDAILIEFNISTGVVLSVFYGDNLNEGESFGYYGDDKRGDNIFGGRGMDASDGYRYARDRRQGYYGVGNTGHLGDEFQALPFNLYDSYRIPLPEGDPSQNQNILYAEIVMPRDRLIGTRYTLSTAPASLIEYTDISLDPSDLPSNLEEAMAGGAPYLYCFEVQGGNICVIWILDYLYDDTTDTDYYSPGGIYNIGNTFSDPAVNIAARIRSGGGLDEESPRVNPYYLSAASYSGGFNVASARHLYNIRYAPGRNFTLYDDIDLAAHGISNFAPIPDFSGSFSGNNKAVINLKTDVRDAGGNAGLFAELRGSVSGLTLVNPVVMGGENAGALCGDMGQNAVMSNVAVVNPDIQGGIDAGAVCGGNGGIINAAYVRFELSGKTITGGNYSGGIAGVNNGTISNSTFISPFPTVHIRGDRSAGIAGLTGDTGKIENVLFLALAPKTGDTIRPITNGGPAAAAVSAYYLSGGPIWPDQDAIDGMGGRSDYNGETANGFGEGASTWELYGEIIQKLSGWKANAGLTEDTVILTSNQVYPYPYLSLQANQLAQPSYWPIAEGGPGGAELLYYELYQGIAEPEYAKYGGGAFDMAAMPAQRIVIQEGYALHLYIDNYDLDIDGTVYKITGLDPDARTGASVEGEVWPVIYNVSAEGEDMAVVFIPNAFLEGISGGADIELQISEVSAVFNPMFAPNDHAVRSPRHLENVRTDPAAAYTQQLHVDFNLYYKNCAVIRNALRTAGNKLQYNNANPAVVTGTFTGVYNGAGKEIRNLTINAPGADRAGLFAVNNGSIHSITMLNAAVTGKDYVGAVAGVNNGTIGQGSGATGRGGNVIIVQPKVSGGSYVGGAAGQNTGTVTDCEVLSDTSLRGFAQVSGTGSNIGGIAGTNSGTIQYTTITVSRGKARGDEMEGAAPNYVYGASNVGGIAGSNTGTGSIQICYADYTEVGRRNYTSTNTGGIVGHMNGGTVKNVFYNFGNSNPQDHAFIESVHGVPASTGYLAGYISSGSLTYAYSDGYLMSGSNILIGGKTASAALPSNVMYLKHNGYNTNITVPTTVAPAASSRTVAQLRALADTNTLNTNNAGMWARGSGAGNGANATTYIYPRLVALAEPAWFPMPEVSEAKIAYYEIYQYPNPNNNNEKYGLWSNDGNDTLDYREEQRILEDGYVVLVTINPGTHFWQYRDLNGNSIASSSGKDVTIARLGNVKGFLLPLDTIEPYMRHTDNKYGALYPIRFVMGHNNGGTDVFDGYINPLFAKSIYTRQQIDRLGDINAKKAYFEGKTGYRYVIRTPRHLNNIGYKGSDGNADPTTLAGYYLQEVDVDFAYMNTTSGYWRTSSVNSSTAKSEINISESVVKGAFAGNYTAKSPYTPDGEFDRTGGRHVKSIKNVTLNGTNHTGNIGVFSQVGTTGVIEDVILKNNSITGNGTSNNVGGLAGANAGTIRRISVENCTVTGSSNVGGVVGGNIGSLKNVSFISVNRPDTVPVKATAGNGAVGGIAGNNTGLVSHVFYLAPAPVKDDVIYPIVGGGGVRAESGFYLSGNQYNVQQGWVTGLYNRVYRNSGGGTGLATKFLNFDWIEFAYSDGFDSEWAHVAGYPYPALWGRTPAGWPSAMPSDAPVGPAVLTNTVNEDMMSMTLMLSNTDAYTLMGIITVDIPADFTVVSGSTVISVENLGSVPAEFELTLAYNGSGDAPYGGINAVFRYVFWDPAAEEFATEEMRFPAAVLE